MTDQAPVDINALKPGMELCTFDYQKWGDVRAIEDHDGVTYLAGTVDGSGVEVFVPFSAVVETHGQCIRLTPVRAEIDAAGWDKAPAAQAGA